MKKTTYLHRRIEPRILEDLNRKMVFIGGPRQCGKTTLARHCAARFRPQKPGMYFNWDIAEDRSVIIAESFPAGGGSIVLDEIHKFSRWRQVVKGLFDGRGKRLGHIPSSRRRQSGA